MKAKKIKKFGKEISFKIDGINGSWLMVKDGGLRYLHLTNKATNTPKPNTPPIYVNRKGMWDLLVHFGCGKSYLSEVYRKKES